MAGRRSPGPRYRTTSRSWDRSGASMPKCTCGGQTRGCCGRPSGGRAPHWTPRWLGCGPCSVTSGQGEPTACGRGWRCTWGRSPRDRRRSPVTTSSMLGACSARRTAGRSSSRSRPPRWYDVGFLPRSGWRTWVPTGWRRAPAPSCCSG